MKISLSWQMKVLLFKVAKSRRSCLHNPSFLIHHLSHLAPFRFPFLGGRERDIEARFPADTAEHLYTYPVTSQKVADWLADGSVVFGRVLLIQSRIDLDSNFNKAIDNDYCITDEQSMQRTFDTKSLILLFTEIIPRNVLMYHRRLRKIYPESKQR
jgi:hypothetical protein